MISREAWAGVIRVVLVCGMIALGLFGGRQVLIDVHRELAALGKSLEISRDFQMRTFHYVKPHEPFKDLYLENWMVLKCCPECADLLREADMLHELGVWVTEARHQELLAIEREAKGRNP